MAGRTAQATAVVAEGIRASIIGFLLGRDRSAREVAPATGGGSSRVSRRPETHLVPIARGAPRLSKRLIVAEGFVRMVLGPVAVAVVPGQGCRSRLLRATPAFPSATKSRATVGAHMRPAATGL